MHDCIWEHFQKIEGSHEQRMHMKKARSNRFILQMSRAGGKWMESRISTQPTRKQNEKDVFTFMVIVCPGLRWMFRWFIKVDGLLNNIFQLLSLRYAKIGSVAYLYIKSNINLKDLFFQNENMRSVHKQNDFHHHIRFHCYRTIVDEHRCRIVLFCNKVHISVW